MFFALFSVSNVECKASAIYAADDDWISALGFSSRLSSINLVSQHSPSQLRTRTDTNQPKNIRIACFIDLK